MKRAIWFGLGAVLLIGLVAVGAFAFPSVDGNETGFGKGKAMRGQGPGNWTGMNWTDMQAHQEAVEAALEAGDYDAWLEAVQDTPWSDEVTSVINEDNFDRLVEMYNLRQDAKDLIGEARDIAEELGIERPFRVGPGEGIGMGPEGHLSPGQGMKQGHFGGRGQRLGPQDGSGPGSANCPN
ncbi:hypothetical protein JW711_01750 [Candidatus Woesearchaeota archaeon]|nr:hypothetical protein [Candidatus Woesearchaeota archaeon]